MVQIDHAGEIAAGTVEARNEPKLDRIRSHHEDNRDRLGRRLGGAHCGRVSERDNDTHLTTDQIGRQGWQAIGLTICPAVFDQHVATFDVAAFRQSLAERRDEGSRIARRRISEEPDHRLVRLLCPRGERQGGRGPEQRHELATFHSIETHTASCEPEPAIAGYRNGWDHRSSKRYLYSITSSAPTKSLSGTVRPSAFAVLRLMNRSNLVGCSTGRSDGCAPLRILST